MNGSEDHVKTLQANLRYFKRELKIANRLRGRQGETIHALRAENALLRERLRNTQAVVNVKTPDPNDESMWGPGPGEWGKLIRAAQDAAAVLEPSKIDGLE